MYLFLNTITRPGNIILFQNGKIIAMELWDSHGNEFDFLLETIEGFLQKNNVNIPNISGIVTVSWPGGFTATRIISLIVNTWRSLYHIPTQSITLFDLFLRSGSDFPLCVKANRGEYLIWSEAEKNPEILPISEIHSGNYSGMWDEEDFTLEQNVHINQNIDYEKFFTQFAFIPEDKNIEPYYIKKPNIT